MDKRQRGILVAMAIGDGHIRPINKGTSATLTITHGMNQKKYAEYKATLLREIFDSDIPQVKVKKNGGHYFGCLIEKSAKYFRILRKWLYSNGIKRPSRLLRFINEEGLAIWYMDDGSLSYKKRGGKIHGRDLTLNTYLSKEENEKISKILENRWGFKLVPVRSKGSWRLRCGSHEAKKIFNIIRPFIIESMSYKIDMKYGG